MCTVSNILKPPRGRIFIHPPPPLYTPPFPRRAWYFVANKGNFDNWKGRPSPLLGPPVPCRASCHCGIVGWGPGALVDLSGFPARGTRRSRSYFLSFFVGGGLAVIESRRGVSEEVGRGGAGAGGCLWGGGGGSGSKFPRSKSSKTPPLFRPGPRYVNVMPEVITPEFLYAMSGPSIAHKERVSPSVISWCAVDYMRSM